MALTDQQAAQFGTFVLKDLGISPTLTRVRFFIAWTRAEGGAETNPLNIGPGKSYGSLEDSAKATASTLKTAGFYGGVVSALRGSSLNKMRDAVKASPWDASHYSNGVLDRTVAGVGGSGIIQKADGDPVGGIGGAINDAAGAGADALKGAVDAVTDPFGFVGGILKSVFFGDIGKIILGVVLSLSALVLIGRKAINTR